MVRNLFDGLSMPTPPHLIDKFTKHPALTPEEYQSKLDEIIANRGKKNAAPAQR